MKIFLVLAFSLSGLTAMGQNSVGFKGGINLAYQESNIGNNAKSNNAKNLFGYQAGLFFKFKESERLSFSTEANFSLIGSNDLYLVAPSNGGTTLTSRYYKNKIGYFEVPLTVQYNLNRLYFGAGPAASLKLFSKSEAPGYKPKYKPFDLSGQLLGGLHVSKNWDVNLRYSYGLINVNDDDDINARKKNRFINFSLLYLLK